MCYSFVALTDSCLEELLVKTQVVSGFIDFIVIVLVIIIIFLK